MSLDEMTKAAVESLMSGEPMEDRKRIEESVEVSFVEPLRKIIGEELESLSPVMDMDSELKKQITEKIVERFLKEIGPN